MIDEIRINVADFSRYPGGRYRRESLESGEVFREDFVEPKYKDALSRGVKLIINIDRTEGKPSSFYNEVFGGLVRKLKTEGESQITLEKIWETIVLESDFPDEVDRVKGYATDRHARDKNLRGNPR